MRRTVTALALLLGLVAIPACGGSQAESPEPEKPPLAEAEGGTGEGLTGAGADRAKFTGASGTAKATACELVGAPFVERAVAELSGRERELEREANDSLDLSVCWFRSTEGPIVAVSVTLDTATKAVRRYYNQITEARQLPNIFDPSPKYRLQLVRDVGDDGTYGGAGAFWIPVRATLTSIRDSRIVKAHFYVAGVPDEKLKEAAARLARLAHERYEQA